MDISHPTGNNTAKVCSIYRVSKSDVDVIVNVPNSNLVDTSEIVLKTGKSWEEIQFLEDTASISFKPDGDLYLVEIPFMVNKTRRAVAQRINVLKTDEHILKVTDLNGTAYLIGNMSAPAMLRDADMSVGAKASEFNGFSMAFAAKVKELCYFVE